MRVRGKKEERRQGAWEGIKMYNFISDLGVKHVQPFEKVRRKEQK